MILIRRTRISTTMISFIMHRKPNRNINNNSNGIMFITTITILLYMVFVIPLVYPFVVTATQHSINQRQQQQQRYETSTINPSSSSSSGLASNKQQQIIRQQTRLQQKEISSSEEDQITSSSTLSTPPIRRRSVGEIIRTLLFPSMNNNLSKMPNTISNQLKSNHDDHNNDNNDNNNDENNSNNLKKSSSRWLGEDDVPISSQLLYNYATPLIRASKTRSLDIKDSLPISSSKDMKYSVSSLQHIYNNEQKKQLQLQQQEDTTLSSSSLTTTGSSSSSWILVKSLIIHQKQMLIRTGILRLFNTGIQAFPALLVARLLRYAEASTTTGSSMTTIYDAIQAALTLVLVLSIKMIIENQYYHNVIHCSNQVRGSLAGLIFDKSLKLSNGGVGSMTSASSTSATTPATTTTTATNVNDKAIISKKTNESSQSKSNTNELGIGGVLNLMQSDTSIIESATLQFHTSWDAPLQIAIYTSLLYNYLGSSVIYGIMVLLCTIPLNSITLRILNKLSIQENLYKDLRTKQTSESIRNIKILKLYNWDIIFLNMISNYRNNEMNIFRLRGIVRAINMAISNAVPAIVLVVTLTAYIRTGRPIVASTIFTAISLFNQLRFPLFFYPMFIDSIANGKNAIQRINLYLNTNEIISYVQDLLPIIIQKPIIPQNRVTPGTRFSIKSSNVVMMNCTGGNIEMLNGNFWWSSSSSSTTPTSTTEVPVSLSSSSDDDDDKIKLLETSSLSDGSLKSDNGMMISISNITSTINNSNTLSAHAATVNGHTIPSTSSIGETTTNNNNNYNIKALNNVTLNVKPGEIIAIIGSVGSGKTALIKGLLGELKPITNDDNNNNKNPVVIRHGEVAYCSQEAWLQKGTLRDAILFGRPYNEQRYREAIYISGLDEDIVDDHYYNNMKSFDTKHKGNEKTNNSKIKQQNGALTHETEVGEGGTSLSGGQRARTALARALYSSSIDNEPKVYLLDDCLASLDAHVSSIVFERLVNKVRESNCATVLVTNDPNIPRRCNRVILMGSTKGTPTTLTPTDHMNVGSTIIDQGTYDELLKRGHDLRSINSRDDNDEEIVVMEDDINHSNSIETTTTSNTNTETINREKSSFGMDTSLDNDATETKTKTTEIPSTMITNIAKEKKNLLVMGGATERSDGDLCLEAWCHSDVEEHTTMMEHCSEYYSNNIVDDDSLHSDEANNNDDDEYKKEYQQIKSINNSDATTPFLFQQESKMNPEALNDKKKSLSTTKVVSSLAINSMIVPTNHSTLQLTQQQLISADDSMSSGAIPLSVYKSYFKAVGSPVLVMAMVLGYLLSNGAQFFQQYIVAKWTEVGASSAMMGATYMRSLVKAAFVVSISLWIRSFLTMSVGIKASKTFHTDMLRSVFAAPMSFFDTTPSGQLLSRFGKEIEIIDRGVPDSIGSTVFCFLQIALSMGALAGIVTPGMLIPLALVSILYVKAMSEFRPAARDMKRVETKTRSPIYTHFGEALRGSEIIRSIRGATSYWSNQHRSLTDQNLRAFYTIKAFDRWLSTRLETLGNTIVFTTSIASVLLTRSGALKPGAAGWGLTQALSVTGLLTWAVRCLADLESNMLSVIRVQELTSGQDSINSNNVQLEATSSSTTTTVQEAKKRTKSSMPKEMKKAGEALLPLLPSSISFKGRLVPLDEGRALVKNGWPWKGKIAFKNVSMKYTPTGPLVLKKINLTVPAGTTLGVVGRTGSGKSSLLVTLFRLVEIEANPNNADDSSIEIDGIDIRSVPVSSLRRSLAIIPQDPVLFTGTLAYNLDATGQSTANDMIAALEAASSTLAEQFLRSPGSNGLETRITEGGKNLSLGQRQLICLARALLRKSKVLVLDEATSAIDAKTDSEVQETIRREFVQKGVTVITVAHRLDTVLGYDKIAVLGNGELLEYGTPNELIAIPGGELRRLVLADRSNKKRGSGTKVVKVKVGPATTPEAVMSRSSVSIS